MQTNLSINDAPFYSGLDAKSFPFIGYRSFRDRRVASDQHGDIPPIVSVDYARHLIRSLRCPGGFWVRGARVIPVVEGCEHIGSLRYAGVVETEGSYSEAYRSGWVHVGDYGRALNVTIGGRELVARKTMQSVLSLMYVAADARFRHSSVLYEDGRTGYMFEWSSDNPIDFKSALSGWRSSSIMLFPVRV